MRFACPSRVAALLVSCGSFVCLPVETFGVEPTHGTFKTSDGVKIHYMEIGQGVPVILIHGYTGNAEGNWFANGIAQALATNHHVIALDCRNHGKSDKPQPHGPGNARDVVELMDHLKIQKAHFHGYSMGGGIV